MLIFIQQGFSQSKSAAFNSIDWKIRSIEVATPDTLAKRLTESCVSDLEKVRAIFRWITENIAYSVKSTRGGSPIRSKVSEQDDTDDSITPLKPLNERVSDMVLKRKTAVCDGYTRLFKTLCDYAGICSEVITGYARTNINRPGQKFLSNHSWNAVMVDSVWQLLDVTWASGFVSYSDEFVKYYDDYYFLTPPNLFILDHFPDELQWTLLPDPPTADEFYRTPFKCRAFLKYNIVSYFPKKGIINASVGDVIKIELETDNPERNLQISRGPFFDSAKSFPESWVFITSDRQPTTKKISYTYIVPSTNVEWLHLLYNDDVIMRYRINIRKEKDDSGIRF